MIDTSNWKEFRVGDLFEVSKAYAYNKETLPESDSTENVHINCVTRTAINNGVDYIADLTKDLKIENGNALTIGGEGVICFYQSDKFVCGTNMTVLRHKQLTVKSGLFISTIINYYSAGRFCYGRAFNKWQVENAVISLPATPSGEPDWKYMEDFMGGLHSEPLKTSVKSSHIPLETEKWGEFRVGDLFDVELAKGDIKLDEMLLGDMPLVSSGETNNGIVGYIDNNGDGKSERFDANRITVDMFGNAYYQSEPFYAVSHGRVNILSPKFDLTPNVGLFLSTIIKGDQYKYSYGRAVYSRVVENMVIRLPQTPDGEPDWAWMENYMRSLPYSDLIAA